MNNGSALTVLIEESNHQLGGYSALDLYQLPLPSAVDLSLDEIVGHAMDLNREEQLEFQFKTNPVIRPLFGVYGHRAATRAVRGGREALLDFGLVAAAIANIGIPNQRRLECSLAVYYHVARKLELNPAEVFAGVAEFATVDLARELVTFGMRDDVTLSKFGWKEIGTAPNIRYKFNWN